MSESGARIIPQSNPGCKVKELPAFAVSCGKAVIRVLHVDDDVSMLDISKAMLMDVGAFEVDNACCVDDAFKELATRDYDVIVSDY